MMRGRQGFTLVEILIAFLIMMIGVLAVMSLFPVGLQMSKEMVEQSTAAMVARNARGAMATAGLADAVKTSYGMDPGQFPKYFPGEMGALAPNFLTALSNPNYSPPLVAKVTADGKGVIDTSNDQYSWDARWTVGRGVSATGVHLLDNDWTAQEVQGWFSKYWRYYTVQISVYRNYKETGLPGGGVVAVTPAAGYVPTDPNARLVCTLTVGTKLPDVTTGWYIRVLDDRSDWYRVERIDTSGNSTVLTLDRVYAGPTGSKSNVIATDRLLGDFTTLVAAGDN